MKLAFRFLYCKRRLPEGGWVFALLSVGMIHPKHADFLVGRSLFELSHLKDGWFMDIVFVHVLTFSRFFWKGVF